MYIHRTQMNLDKVSLTYPEGYKIPEWYMIPHLRYIMLVIQNVSSNSIFNSESYFLINNLTLTWQRGHWKLVLNSFLRSIDYWETITEVLTKCWLKYSYIYNCYLYGMLFDITAYKTNLTELLSFLHLSSYIRCDIHLLISEDDFSCNPDYSTNIRGYPHITYLNHTYLQCIL